MSAIEDNADMQVAKRPRPADTADKSASIAARLPRMLPSAGGRSNVTLSSMEQLEAQAESVLAIDKYSIPAWSFRLLRATSKFPLTASGRATLDAFLKLFPFAASIWRTYLEFEIAAQEWTRAEDITRASLQQCLDVGLCDSYITLVALSKAGLSLAERNLATNQAFDFVLDLVGTNPDALPLWWRYFDFLDSIPIDSAQDRSAVQELAARAYRRALQLPLTGLHALWVRFDTFPGKQRTITAVGGPVPAVAARVLHHAYTDALSEAGRRLKFHRGRGLPAATVRLDLPADAGGSAFARARVAPRPHSWMHGAVGAVTALPVVLARPRAADASSFPLPALLARFAAVASEGGLRLGMPATALDAALVPVFNPRAAVANAGAGAGAGAGMCVLPNASPESLPNASFSPAGADQVARWMAFLSFERTNPMRLEPHELRTRVRVAFLRAKGVCCFSAEYWHAYAVALYTAALPTFVRTGNSDVDAASATMGRGAGMAMGSRGAVAAPQAQMAMEGSLEGALAAGKQVWAEAAARMPYSLLIRLAQADFLEDAGATADADAVYTELLSTEAVADALATLQQSPYALAPEPAPEAVAGSGAGAGAGGESEAGEAAAAESAPPFTPPAEAAAVVPASCRLLCQASSTSVEAAAEKASAAGVLTAAQAELLVGYRTRVIARRGLGVGDVSTAPAATAPVATDAVGSKAAAAAAAASAAAAVASKQLKDDFDFGVPVSTPPLAYISAMRFRRRTQSVEAAREVFRRARRNPRCPWEVYVEAATSAIDVGESFETKALIYRAAAKTFLDDPAFARVYVEFLEAAGDVGNLQALLETLREPAHTEGKAPAYVAWVWSRHLALVQARSRPLPDVERVQCARNEALGLAPPVVTALGSKADEKASVSRNAAKQLYGEYLRPGVLASAQDNMRVLSQVASAASASEDPLNSLAGRLSHTGVLEVLERHAARGMVPCSVGERDALVRARLRHYSEVQFARDTDGDHASVNLKGAVSNPQLLQKLKSRFTSPAPSALTPLTPAIATAFRFPPGSGYEERQHPRIAACLRPDAAAAAALPASVASLLHLLQPGPMPRVRINVSALLRVLARVDIPTGDEVAAAFNPEGYAVAARLFKDVPLPGAANSAAGPAASAGVGAVAGEDMPEDAIAESIRRRRARQ